MEQRTRFNVVCIGRRSGKTEMGKMLAIEPSVLSYPVGWFSPTYKDMLEVWRSVVDWLRPITTRVNSSERRVELITGGVLEFWSLDNPNSGRGRRYKRIIVDEAAFVKNLMDAWNKVLFPTLADFSGDAWIFSTPKGRNDFYRLWKMSDGGKDWSSWQMPTTVNPHIAPSEIDIMRESMPERIFQQEILAEFLEDGGGVFRNVRECVGDVGQTGRRSVSSQYLFGVDWGKHHDFTVIAVIDITTGNLVHLDRFNQIDYTLQRGRLVSLYERFKPIGIYAEANSIGDPNIEQLRADGLPVYAFQTTAVSKKLAIDGLSLAFERGDITIINDETLIDELLSYEVKRLPSGNTTYAAPDGMHDDTVMALAIAWHGITAAQDTYRPLTQPANISRW
jgi:hypothetical protein